MFLFDILSKKTAIAKAEDKLPGRDEAIATAQTHFVSGRPLKGPYPEGAKTALFGLGCFWGAERVFWEAPGVWVTAAGYAAGRTPNPTYQEVCSGGTGHNEVVLVVYNPDQVSYADLLQRFFEAHDPTQGMRQGYDVGTQYRSGIYVFDDMQQKAAEQAITAYQEALTGKGVGRITTEIKDAPPFYFAEDHHQQYLAKNPGGYCGLGGTGVTCPVIPAEATS
jgi:peptide-methionine (S)-S-oxide reductase